MEELQVINHNNVDVIDSREVAEMIGKDHRHLIRDIRGYTEILKNTTEPNFGLSDFFIESNYKDSTGRTLPCYLLTRKGCDFIASRMTGKKGVQFSARYVCAFDAMRKQTDTAQAEIMLRMENCKLQKAQLLREMAQQYQGGPFEQTLNACAAKLMSYNSKKLDSWDYRRKRRGENHADEDTVRHVPSRRGRDFT